MIVVITGTPGVGKTSVSKELSKLLSCKVVAVKDLKAKTGYDKKMKCDIVDIAKVASGLRKIKEKNIIFESHLAHFLSPSMIKLCVVLRCKPPVLKSRLKKIGYSKSKIKENYEAEALDIILQEAVKKKHKVHEVDTTGKSAQKVALGIFSVVKGKKKRKFGIINFSKFLVPESL